MEAGAWEQWGTGLAEWGGKGPIGRPTTRTVPVGGHNKLSSSLQSKWVAPQRFKMKADTMLVGKDEAHAGKHLQFGSALNDTYR